MRAQAGPKVDARLRMYALLPNLHNQRAEVFSQRQNLKRDALLHVVYLQKVRAEGGQTR